MPHIEDTKAIRGDESVFRRHKAGWWETENAGSNEWPVRKSYSGVISNSNANATSMPDAIEAPPQFVPIEPAAIAQTSESPKFESQKVHRDLWLARRGHALSFAGLFMFTVVLYFRPYELFPSLSAFSSIAFWLAAATFLVFIPSQLVIEGNVTARPREVDLVLLLAVTALLSIPFAIDREEAWSTFNDPFIKAVAMFIVMINVVRTERRLKMMLLLSVFVGCVLSFGALRDFHNGVLSIEGYRVSGSIGGMFGNPNDMALYLVTVTPITAALCFASKRLPGTIFYGSLTMMLMGAIMVTYSRGGFLGLAAAGFVLAWKIGRKNRYLITVCSFLGLVAFIALAPGGYGERLLSILRPKLDAVGSATARKQLLIRSLWVAARHPLFGIGMGNFHIVSIHELVSHNAYTQVAAELGLTALILYVLFMVTPFKKLGEIERETFARSKDVRTSYYLAVGLQASIVGYMVSSFFVSVAYLWYIYYLVGFAVALRGIYAVQQANARSPSG